MSQATGSSPAVSYLRRRTLWRSLHTYRVWVGKAVGWWSILYLIFWLVIFALSGAEAIQRRTVPFSQAMLEYTALAVGFFFLLRSLSGRAPPVVLDRRDLYRLGLAPVVPWHALRYRLNMRRTLMALVGALVGGLWSLLAPPYFHLSAPWAAPVLALLAVVYVDLAWLRYTGRWRSDAVGAAARLATALIIGVVVLTVALPPLISLIGASTGYQTPRYSPLAGLAWPQPYVLLLPLLLAAASHFAVRRSLADTWPPRFAAQSLVLTQLQAMRAFQLLAGLAGMGGAVAARQADAGERRRLLDTLHDRPGVTRPRRSLKPPALASAPWRAMAWRSATLLYRRPRWSQLSTALFALGAVISLLAASQVVAGVSLFATPQPSVDPSIDALAGGAATQGGTFVGAIGVLLAAFVMARAGASLLGPSTIGVAAPLRASDRTLGRLTPALLVLGVLTLLAVPIYLFIASGALGWPAGAAAGTPPDTAIIGQVLLAFAVLTLTCLAALEKYSSWSGAAVTRWEPLVVSALLVALPSILLIAFDAASWTLPVQFGLLAIVWLIEV